jgi:hypothetical protein
MWWRLIGSARDPTLALGQQVQVRDPLWFLARQWQVGELAGFDGGSPTDAAYTLQQTPLTGYQAFAATDPEPITPTGAPLEVRAERETVELGLLGSLQLGLRFEAIAQAITTDPQTVITWSRTTFPLAPGPPATEIPDPAAIALRAASTGRVTDGWQLYQALQNTGSPPAIPPAAQPAIAAFTTYCQTLYSTPTSDSAWNVTNLRYQFTTTATTPTGPTITLATSDYPGGTLDWYDFDYVNPPASALVPGTVTHVIPHHIWFTGMPTNKWWEYEDGATDLGAFITERTDLTKMLLAEFAAVCANDWFDFTIPVPLGTLSSIAALVVTDTFGIRTLIPPASQAPAATSPTAPASASAWQMFTLTSDNPATGDISGTLLLPPVLGRVEDGPALENVVFLRDDQAAMCWAVEDTLMGPLDNARSGYESQLTPPPAPAPLPPGVDINYLLGNTVPANWIPLLPFTATGVNPTYPAGTLNFRRGAMLAPSTTNGTEPARVTPRGQILQPSAMLIIRDQAIPRTGTQANSYFRRTRWIDGSIYCWMARQVQPGTKYGSSGLAFDILEPSGT